MSLALGQNPLAVAHEEAPGASHALIVVGIPGDAEHAELFTSLTSAWVEGLTKHWGVPSDHIHVLFSGQGDAHRGWTAATKENLQTTATQLREKLTANDSLWVFTLAHADRDGRRGWLHLPGPDINDAAWATLFADLPCQRQVFWMTHSCSGDFLASLSRPGRIIATATEPLADPNETEFPQALANLFGKPLAELDRNHDSRVSLAELFVQLETETKRIYESDRRSPTENALLDDNGDGRGTTPADLIEFVLDRPAGAPAPDRLPSGRRIDGAVSEVWNLPVERKALNDDRKPPDKGDSAEKQEASE